jgi:hypothetical protein
VIEILRFRLAEGADEGGFRATDKRVQEEFAYHQPGLLRRTTARAEDGSWVIVDLWRSLADAEACDARWGSDGAAQAFMSLVDASSLSSERYFELG